MDKVCKGAVVGAHCWLRKEFSPPAAHTQLVEIVAQVAFPNADPAAALQA